MLTVISLGAGVQSSTLALMAARGELSPMPDCAIFADTQAEPRSVYRHLEFLTASLPFPVHVVTVGNLRDAVLSAAAGSGRSGSDARPPFFVANHDGSRGMIRRQCTGDYKIDPIQRKIRELLGLRPRQRWPSGVAVEQWLGISRDEASRMKPSRIPAIRARWPLIELGMSRRDCLDWLDKNNYPTPPKSACTFCPFHSDAEWRRLRDHEPEAWAEAVRVDEAIRHGLTRKGLTAGALYLHSSLVPLAEADLSTPEDRGQLNLWENECEGMCGV